MRPQIGRLGNHVYIEIYWRRHGWEKDHPRWQLWWKTWLLHIGWDMSEHSAPMGIWTVAAGLGSPTRRTTRSQ